MPPCADRRAVVDLQVLRAAATFHLAVMTIAGQDEAPHPRRHRPPQAPIGSLHFGFASGACEKRAGHGLVAA